MDLQFTRQPLLPRSHSTTSVRGQWMEIILTNKPGKHNYKQKYELKMRHRPDLNQRSPGYYTGSLTAKQQHHVSS